MNQLKNSIVAYLAIISLMLLSSAPLVAQYCASSSTNSGYEWLTNVTFAGIDNTSEASGYSDFTAISGSVTAGMSYEFSGTLAQEVFIGDNEYIQVWIDWNQDETFSPDERTQIGDVCNFDNCTLTSMVAVPFSALEGNTRMRVVQSWNVPSTDPCFESTPDAGFDGETEDYTISVTAVSCTPPEFTFSTTTVCAERVYMVSSILDSFGSSQFLKIFITRSDAVLVPTLNISSVDVSIGDEIQIVNNIPEGVTVSILVEAADPTCNITAEFEADICPDVNDSPCNAIALPNDGSVYLGNNLGATADIGEVAPPQGGCSTDSTWCDNSGELFGSVDNSVWFTFVAPESGRVRIDGCNEGADFDNQFAVYTVGNCNDYSTYELVAANEDRPFAIFGSCEFGLFRAALDICVEPGETYYLQVDGYQAAEGTIAVSIEEMDAAACSCVPPVIPAGFTYASTEANCIQGDIGYTVAFFAPEDLGSSEFFVFTYSYAFGDTLSVNVPAGGTFDIDDVIPLDSLIYIEINISDPNCNDANTGFPLSATIGQNVSACDLDCEGVAGGDAGPGTLCDASGQPGSYNDDCECIPTPVNDLPCNAIALDCGSSESGSTVDASQSGIPLPSCAGGAIPADVFYSLDAVPNIQYTVTVNGLDYDGTLSLYLGECDATLVEVACADNGLGDNDAETISFSVDTILTVLIRTFDYDGSGGNYTISVTCEDNEVASLNGTIGYNSSCDDRESTVTFYEPNTAIVAATYTTTVTPAGEFTIPEVLIGTYDIIVDVPGYLNKGLADVVTISGANAADFGAIIQGDIDGNNGFNVTDFSAQVALFGLSDTSPGYNVLADLDCSGLINVVDFSIITGIPFGQNGAVAPLP